MDNWSFSESETTNAYRVIETLQTILKGIMNYAIANGEITFNHMQAIVRNALLDVFTLISLTNLWRTKWIWFNLNFNLIAKKLFEKRYSKGFFNKGKPYSNVDAKMDAKNKVFC